MKKNFFFIASIFFLIAGIFLAVAWKWSSGKADFKEADYPQAGSSGSEDQPKEQELYPDVQNPEELKTIKEKYEIAGSVLTMKSKDKDGVKTVVGKEDSREFLPELTLSRWDGEVSLRVAADVSDTPAESRHLAAEGNKIKFETPKNDYHFYDRAPDFQNPEGGYEIDTILKEKPASNKIVFSLETKGLDFFYQPPLNVEKHPEADSCTETECLRDGKVIIERPENVVGSYAVYYKGHSGDYSQMGGKIMEPAKLSIFIARE